MEVRNVVIIVVDALRARNLGCYGYSKNTSPNIDSLAREGVLFEQAYCCSNCTDPSLTAMLSGKYPISSGIVNHGARVTEEEIQEFHGKRIALLSEMLQSRGFSTLAVDWLGRWHGRGYTCYCAPWDGGTRGFLWRTGRRLSRVRLRMLQQLSGLVVPGWWGRELGKFPDADARKVCDRAVELISASGGRRFLLLVHFWDTHSRYNPPRRFAEAMKVGCGQGRSQRFDEILGQIGDPKWRDYIRYCVKGAADVDDVIARYDGAIAYVDHEIGRLVDALRQNGLLEKTLIVLTSDHGESLADHGIYFTHHGLYEETIHVPLILSHAGLPGNRRVRGLVQHIDIVPTVLDLLKVEAESALDGESLLPLISGKVEGFRSAVYVEEFHTERKRTIRAGSYKYIHALSPEGAVCRYCRRVHGDMEELYDLRQDPLETTNIIAAKPEVASELRERLSEWAMHLQKKSARGSVEGRIRELKSMGRV